eukprot:TRINITY_DN7087_c0_g1_i2.p1 TRINITY_DN7087_c0_g1~~TRINITY_DN7087_c0_g1_i2.p1  ORF type:complete len:695 (-),score=213.09 TRINITY_DN7087_c0_g1_i2:31-1821(-)
MSDSSHDGHNNNNNATTTTTTAPAPAIVRDMTESEILTSKLQALDDIKTDIFRLRQELPAPETTSRSRKKAASQDSRTDYEHAEVSVPSSAKDAKDWTDTTKKPAVLIGDDALQLNESDLEHYELHRPFRNGYIQTSPDRSSHTSCNDIQTIWEHALSRRLGPPPPRKTSKRVHASSSSSSLTSSSSSVPSSPSLSSSSSNISTTNASSSSTSSNNNKSSSHHDDLTREPPRDFENYFAVLVIPDMFDKRDVKDLLNILLRDMRFRAAFVHMESVCATFGAGITSAVVVDIGHTKTTVSCVEDGVSLPMSRVHMAYGGEDIANYMAWLLHRKDAKDDLNDEVIHKFDFPSHHGLDTFSSLPAQRTLRQVKENLCSMELTDTQTKSMEVVIQERRGDPQHVYKIRGNDIGHVTAMTLFHPNLAYAPEKPFISRSVGWVDAEDVFEDVAPGEGGVGKVAAKVLDSEINRDPEAQNRRAFMPLDDAIAKSISGVERVDARRRLCALILLCGGGSTIPGLADVLEEKLLYTLPMDADGMDKIEVLYPPLRKDVDPRFLMWRGGAIAGCLESGREMWVLRQEWLEGSRIQILRDRLPFHWW